MVPPSIRRPLPRRGGEGRGEGAGVVGQGKEGVRIPLEGASPRIAAATIFFAPRKKPREWWMAMTANPKSSRIRQRENVFFVERVSEVMVDYGCASFMDAKTAKWLDRRMVKN